MVGSVTTESVYRSTVKTLTEIVQQTSVKVSATSVNVQNISIQAKGDITVGSIRQRLMTRNTLTNLLYEMRSNRVQEQLAQKLMQQIHQKIEGVTLFQFSKVVNLVENYVNQVLMITMQTDVETLLNTINTQTVNIQSTEGAVQIKDIIQQQCANVVIQSYIQSLNQNDTVRQIDQVIHQKTENTVKGLDLVMMIGWLVMILVVASAVTIPRIKIMVLIGLVIVGVMAARYSYRIENTMELFPGQRCENTPWETVSGILTLADAQTKCEIDHGTAFYWMPRNPQTLDLLPEPICAFYKTKHVITMQPDERYQDIRRPRYAIWQPLYEGDEVFEMTHLDTLPEYQDKDWVLDTTTMTVYQKDHRSFGKWKSYGALSPHLVPYTRNANYANAISIQVEEFVPPPQYLSHIDSFFLDVSNPVVYTLYKLDSTLMKWQTMETIDGRLCAGWKMQIPYPHNTVGLSVSRMSIQWRFASLLILDVVCILVMIVFYK